MRGPDIKDMASQLATTGFSRTAPSVATVSDPIADTPMVLTLDQLSPYHGNPRSVRNPRYDEILASIRERGLDSPPPVTRRPGDTKYMIRNGGNTRLDILNELWTETRDEKFFRISCLFRPWPSRGEVTILVGHLCENELRGDLSFIERAVAVERARALYESDTGSTLTQTELARRLSADGYPITQSHISRYQDCIRYLLPAIPTVLYAGLGKPQVERLTALRRAAQRIWERRPERHTQSGEFGDLFRDLLGTFDADPDQFRTQRVQDELIGRLSEELHEDYEVIALELIDAGPKSNAVVRESAADPTSVSQPSSIRMASPRDEELRHPSPSASSSGSAPAAMIDEGQGTIARSTASHPAPDATRLQRIRRTIAAVTGDAVNERAPPNQTSEEHDAPTVSNELWRIDAELDNIEALRRELGRLVLEIAASADAVDGIEIRGDGLGFSCHPSRASLMQNSQKAPLRLLQWLSSPYLNTPGAPRDGVRLLDDLAPLLIGWTDDSRHAPSFAPLSDCALQALFRLICLARRLLELNGAAGNVHASQ